MKIIIQKPGASCCPPGGYAGIGENWEHGRPLKPVLEVRFCTEPERDSFVKALAAAKVRGFTKCGSRTVVFNRTVDDALIQSIRAAGIEVDDKRKQLEQA